MYGLIPSSAYRLVPRRRGEMHGVHRERHRRDREQVPFEGVQERSAISLHSKAQPGWNRTTGKIYSDGDGKAEGTIKMILEGEVKRSKNRIGIAVEWAKTTTNRFRVILPDSVKSPKLKTETGLCSFAA